MTMRFSNLALLNGSIKIGVTFFFICVIYYSYLPLLYIINVLQIDKDILFICIVSLSSFFGMLYFICSGMRINKNLMIVIGLYLLFSIYSLISFLVTPDYLNDIFTIRTLTVINPIFILLALLCRNEKQYILKLLYFASLVYFLFAMHRFIAGELAIKSSTFQDIFGLLESAPYQNINLYLGILVILTVVKAKYERIVLKKCSLYLLSLCSVGFMLLIGSRAALFAAMVVGMIFYIVEYKYSSLVTRFRSFLFLFVIVFFIVVFYSSVISLLKDMITFQRIQVLFGGDDPSQRFFLFSSAIELFLSTPNNVIFGAGINSFPMYIGEYSTGPYPHNIILELLAEYGVFGTFLFFSPIAYVLLFRKSKSGNIYGKSVAERSIFLLVIYLWTVSMFTGGLRGSWVLMFFTYLLFPTAQKIRDKDGISHKLIPSNLSVDNEVYKTFPKQSQR